MDRIGGWIVVAALIIAAAILLKPAQPAPSQRYTLSNSEWGLVRFDTWTGRAESCGKDGCVPIATGSRMVQTNP